MGRYVHVYACEYICACVGCMCCVYLSVTLHMSLCVRVKKGGTKIQINYIPYTILYYIITFIYLFQLPLTRMTFAKTSGGERA